MNLKLWIISCESKQLIISHNLWRYCGMCDFVVSNDRQWHKVTTPNLNNPKLGSPQRSKSHVLIRNRIFYPFQSRFILQKVFYILVCLTLKIYSRTYGLRNNWKISFRILTVELPLSRKFVHQKWPDRK